MTTIEVKTNFHKLIDVIEDDKMLRDMYDCIATFAIENESKMTDSQLNRLELSISQIGVGQTISNKNI